MDFMRILPWELEGITSPCCLLIGQYSHHMTLCPPVAIVKRCYGIRLYTQKSTYSDEKQLRSLHEDGTLDAGVPLALPQSFVRLCNTIQTGGRTNGGQVQTLLNLVQVAENVQQESVLLQEVEQTRQTGQTER